MPAEVARLQHPLGARDRRVLAVVGCVAVLGVAAPFALRPTHAETGPRPGCIQGSVAGVMGGGIVRGCGATARALCGLYASDYPTIATQCAAVPGAGRRP